MRGGPLSNRRVNKQASAYDDGGRGDSQLDGNGYNPYGGEVSRNNENMGS
jgi:hypothetical protein